MLCSPSEKNRSQVPYYLLKSKDKRPDCSEPNSNVKQTSPSYEGRGGQISLRENQFSMPSTERKRLQFDPAKYAEAIEQKRLPTDNDTALTLSSTEPRRTPMRPHELDLEEPKTKDKTNENHILSILTSPKAQDSRARSASKPKSLLDNLSPRFVTDSIFSHQYVAQSIKSPNGSKKIEFPQQTKTIPKQESAPKIKPEPSKGTIIYAKSNSQARLNLGNSRSPSKTSLNSSIISGQTKSSNMRTSTGFVEKKKVFDRLYQEKGLLTLFAKSPEKKIAITEIQESKKELKRTHSRGNSLSYDLTAIASPKIVNYWIENKEPQEAQRYSSKSTYSSSAKMQIPTIINQGPVVNRRVAVRISDTFATDSSINSEMFSRILSPVSLKTTQPDDFVTTTTDYTLPTMPTEMDSGRRVPSQNPLKAILQTTVTNIPTTSHFQRDLDAFDQFSNGSTLKPAYKNFAAQKLQLLQKENIPSSQNLMQVISPTGQKRNVLAEAFKNAGYNTPTQAQPQLQQTLPKPKSALTTNKFGTIYEVDEFYSTDRTFKDSEVLTESGKENIQHTHITEAN